MSRLLRIFVFLGLSVPLTWIWLDWGQRWYARNFGKLALPIYGLFGATTVMPTGSRQRFINYLPFLILMLVTPRLRLRRRILGIVIGFVLIFLSHVAFVWISHIASGGGGPMNVLGLPILFPALLFCDAFPLVLWVIIAHEYVSKISARIFEPRSADGGASP